MLSKHFAHPMSLRCSSQDSVAKQFIASVLLCAIFQVVREEFVQHGPYSRLISWLHVVTVKQLQTCGFRQSCISLHEFFADRFLIAPLHFHRIASEAKYLLKSLSALSLLMITANCALVVRTVSQRAVKTSRTSPNCIKHHSNSHGFCQKAFRLFF